MPELPEVETVRLGLQKLVVGKQIKSVKYDWTKSFPNDKLTVDNFMVGAKVTSIKRRAKVLIIELSTNYSLVIHLKMTGQLVFVGKQQIQAGAREMLTGNGEKTQKETNPLPSSQTPNPKRWGAGHPSDSLINKLPDKSTRVEIEFTDRSKLFFNDQRKFGWMRLVPTFILDEYATGLMLGTMAKRKRSAQRTVRAVPRASTAVGNAASAQELSQTSKLELIAGESGIKAVVDFMKKLGPEPLEQSFTTKVFEQALNKRKNSNIKAALLDQTTLAGIGNIYADESLYLAGIHPLSRVGGIPKARIKKLHTAIIEVLTLSIEKGGSTDRNYVNAEGKKGSYIEFAKVFRKDNLPCPQCGRIINKIKVAGRGTHVCSKCQRIYK